MTHQVILDLSNARETLLPAQKQSSPDYSGTELKSPNLLNKGDHVLLTPEQSAHLQRVLRLPPESEIEVVAWGKYYRARLDGSDRKGCLRVSIEEPLPKSCYHSPVDRLCFAWCKGDKNEIVCEKASELGVAKIWYWESARSIAKLESKKLSAKLERLKKIAESSANQSKRSSVAEIALFPSLEELLLALGAPSAGETRILCSLNEQSKRMSSLKERNKVTLAVGPEGDFSPEEEESFLQHGFSPVRLAANTLRSETAAIAAISSCNALFEEER